VFGEMALLTGEPRSADVVATSPCRCLELRRDAVQALMAEHPAVARFLTTLLGQRLLRSDGIRKVGKYRLLGELGRGSMGVVYEAVHPTLERPVAIKMLSHELVYQPEFAERFRNEAKIIARLREPGIVQVFDTEEAYATFFIVMEMLPGTSLEDHIAARGRLSCEETRDILRQLALALEVAHRHGIVHRDVKPSNVVVSPDGRVKLMDFGLALDREVEPEAARGEALRVGTPVYMAPEQITGDTVGPASDIYALGIIAHEMLTGFAPYRGNMLRVMDQHLTGPVPSPQIYVPEVDDELDLIVQRACAKMPEERFSGCAEMLAALGGEPPPAVLSHLAVHTVTFVCPREREGELEELLEEMRRRGRAIPGVEVD
jgi:serine/threonine protein kinase